MKVLSVLSIVLTFVAIFASRAEAKPKPVTSNVNCAAAYLSCLELENSSNPSGMQTVSKRCKDKIRALEPCQGHYGGIYNGVQAPRGRSAHKGRSG